MFCVWHRRIFPRQQRSDNRDMIFWMFVRILAYTSRKGCERGRDEGLGGPRCPKGLYVPCAYLRILCETGSKEIGTKIWPTFQGTVKKLVAKIILFSRKIHHKSAKIQKSFCSEKISYTFSNPLFRIHGKDAFFLL